MNWQSAQSITGCQIEIEKGEDGYFLVALKDGKEVATSGGDNLKKSLATLVERVYAINREKAMLAGDWKCSRCGKIAPLQAHHKVHRARGQRQDDAAGLEPLCAACHEKHHRGK